MESFEIWLSPLLLLPGAGLLIMSTSARFNALHDELHHIIDHHENYHLVDKCDIDRRAALFHKALILLYCSVFFFSTGGLLGGITSEWRSVSIAFTLTLTILGILSLISATFFLFLESLRTRKIIVEHIDEL